MDLLAQAVLPQLGYNIDAIADPVEELKNILRMTSGYRDDDENFEWSLLKELGYRTDAIAPDSLEEAVQILLADYRTDAKADPRDLITTAAMRDMGKHIKGFTDEISKNVVQWQADGLSVDEISDRLDDLYNSEDYQGDRFADGFADWLMIAHLDGAIAKAMG
jgi:hypothetical protein